MYYGYGLFYDPTWILLIPAILLGIWASWKVRSTFNKYSKVTSYSQARACDVAEEILSRNGITNVKIEPTAGSLSDHYDPRTRTLCLSQPVYNSPSIAAIGVAAHECGHALQHASGYVALKVRTAIYPLAAFGSYLLIPLLIGGFIFQWGFLIQIGIILYSFAVFFTLITLPVEFNASRRAIEQLSSGGILHEGEIDGAKKVLNAAALTYVASALTALIWLLRLVLMSRR
jgi:Zn-dependent membrane protease YugP